MFTTHVQRFAAAADLDAMFSGEKSGSSTYLRNIATSSSVISSPRNSDSLVLKASTFCIITFARAHVRFLALYSFSTRIKHALVTLSTPLGGFASPLSSESMFLLRQSTAAPAASIAGLASASSPSASTSILSAFSDSSLAFAASICAASCCTLATSFFSLISSMRTFVAAFFSSTFSRVILRSICNSVTSCDVFRSVDRPTSRRSVCRCSSPLLIPSRYLKKDISSKYDLGVT
mmetsp:Transcript_24071/g.52401  ORF Transcript_24071/g.52401 Transcript_24071/m.52401 type:complete len:234 (+) Transcript_24071:4971-5672(+)